MAFDDSRDTDAYREAIEFLYSRINYEKGHASYSASNYRLDRMRRLLELLGNPHDRYKIVHVAGTKGKGTTSTTIAALLHACGERVGVYTSPHLLRLEERIHCIGRDCTASEMVGLVQRVRTAAEQVEGEGGGRPTFFEMTTAMGMLRFADVNCSYVVLEVGLGGRLDSTNVCRPVACVITSISLDHQAQLGNTIGEIAGEKAGIIKQGIPLVCTARAPEAREVILRVAQERSSENFFIDRDFSAVWRPLSTAFERSALVKQAVAEIEFQPIGFCSQFGESPWPLPLLGKHQGENICGALAAIEVLVKYQGLRLPTVKALQDSLLNTQVPARLQIVGAAPIRIIDTAHNPASIAATIDAIETHFPGKKITTVFASSRDKDYLKMLMCLTNRCTRVVLTAYKNNPRVVTTEELSSALGICSPGCAELSIMDDAWDAWTFACESAKSDEIICACGSFFLAAELLDRL